MDITKALSIIFMIFLHIYYVASLFNSSFNPNFNFVLMNLLGRPYAAVIFMFCMGIGIVYSRHSQWDVMIKRGVKLYLSGILVNVFEFFIPHFVAGALLGKADAFPIHGVYCSFVSISWHLPDTIIKAFTILSTNINMIYIVQWLFVPLTIIFVSYLAKDLVLNDLLTSLIAIFMIILSAAIAVEYKKLRTRS